MDGTGSANVPKRTRELRGIVIGAGPAGLALGRALTDAGVDVLCVDPLADAPWRTTWGLWNDEVNDLGLQGCVVACAAAPSVRMTDTERIVLKRGYSVLDPERLRQHLAPRAPERFELVRERATVIGQDHVVTEGGAVHQARFVVDCRGATTTSCAQTAVGAFVRAEHETVLMDFSLEHDDEDPRPSFGYVVPVGGGRTLVEETSLCSAPPMARETLERRLARRLAALHLTAEGTEREWVSIPLDVRALGPGAKFGVRGGAVHPATGYALARMLADAPRVADAIRSALERDATPEQIARAAAGATWSVTTRLSHAAFRFGRDVLLQLDLAHLRGFFRSFFGLPEHDQRSFLTLSSPVQTVLRAMARMWLNLSWSLRRKILGTVGVNSGSWHARADATERTEQGRYAIGTRAAPQTGPR